MIYVAGNVFVHRLKSDSKEALFNTFPLALIDALLPYNMEVDREINLYTRIKEQKDLKDIRQYLEAQRVLFPQIEDTDDYVLDDYDLETMLDGFDYSTVVIFSNIDDYYETAGSFGQTNGCKLIAYVNKPFLEDKDHQYIDYYFIEEAVALAYKGDIPEEKYTIIPKGMSDKEAAAIVSKKVIEIDDALKMARAADRCS